jgi:hypothetical protein
MIVSILIQGFIFLPCQYHDERKLNKYKDGTDSSGATWFKNTVAGGRRKIYQQDIINMPSNPFIRI